MDDFISIAEATRLRGVTCGAISNLVDRGRLKAESIAGRRVLRRGGVAGFKPQVGGVVRPAANP